jgi:hypothetical protein
VFRTSVLMGTWVLSECMLFVLVVACMCVLMDEMACSDFRSIYSDTDLMRTH